MINQLLTISHLLAMINQLFTIISQLLAIHNGVPFSQVYSIIPMVELSMWIAFGGPRWDPLGKEEAQNMHQGWKPFERISIYIYIHMQLHTYVYINHIVCITTDIYIYSWLVVSQWCTECSIQKHHFRTYGLCVMILFISVLRDYHFPISSTCPNGQDTQRLQLVLPWPWNFRVCTLCTNILGQT